MTANAVFGIVCTLIGLPFMLWIIWQILRSLGGAIGWLIEASRERRFYDQQQARRDIERRIREADARLRWLAEGTRQEMIRAAEAERERRTDA